MKKKLGLISLSLSILLLFTGCEASDPVQTGTTLLKEKKYEEAITSFETAIEKEQNESEAFRGVGIAQYELGNYEDALTAFNQALEFEDAVKTPTLYNLMGICSMKLTDYQGAVNNFNAGILVSENEKKNKTGDTETGKEEETEENAEEKEDTDYTEVLKEMRYNLIVSYEKLEDWGNAKQAVADYLENYPDDEEAQKEAAFLETR